MQVFSHQIGSRTARVIRTAKLSRSAFSTQRPNHKPSQKLSPFLAATLCLTIGIPAGFAIGRRHSYGPLSESKADFDGLYEGSLDWKRKFVKPFTICDVNAWLQKEQSCHIGAKGSGVREWHSVRCASNVPSEDNLVSAQYRLSGSSDTGNQPWLFWGVFDGHLGTTTSTILRESLVAYVARSLNQLFRSPPQVEETTKEPPEAAVCQAIGSAFKKLDDEIISDGINALKNAKTHTEALARLAHGYAGSCAVLAIFDPNNNLLRVACTGDSRVVLGAIDPSTKRYLAKPLSLDQTGFNASEIARLKIEHPDEEELLNEKTGRVLGMAVSRAFGDGLWKWPREVIEECHDHFWWRRPLKGYLTPPYLTAEPVVTTTKIKRGGEFVILASDGFWDCVSNEQAVGLVEMWMRAKNEGTIGKEIRKEQNHGGIAWRIPSGRKAREEDFVVVDENCAAHLVRNALGGSDEEVLCGVVGAQPSISRDARDDITIQVVFFEDKGQRAWS